MAADAAQWAAKDKFARIVAELCRTYPNVNCELAYLTEWLAPGTKGQEALALLKANLRRASAGSGRYALMDKIDPVT